MISTPMSATSMTNSNASPDSGEGVLLVALNDNGSDQTKTLQTSFPSGTVLKDYTGNQPANVTVNGSGQVTITVPARGGQGFVCYAPLVAEGPVSGEALRFTQSGTAVGTMPWVVPGGRDAPAKPRTIPRITGDSVDIEIHHTDPAGGSVANALVKWGQGRNLNASATDLTGDDTVTGGFEQATFSGGIWKLTADLTGVPDGLHTIKAPPLQLTQPPDCPRLYQTFTKTVYVDRAGPDLVIELPPTPPPSPATRSPSSAMPTAPPAGWRPASMADPGRTPYRPSAASGRPISPASPTAPTRSKSAPPRTISAPSPAQINTATASRSFTVTTPVVHLRHQPRRRRDDPTCRSSPPHSPFPSAPLPTR